MHGGDTETRTRTTPKRRGAGHSLERDWYIASREPPDALPRIASTSHLHPKASHVHITSYSRGSQASPSVQPTPPREFLVRSNQRSSETSQASYGHSGCKLNFVRIFYSSLPLPLFRRFFLFPHPRGHKPATPFAYYIVPSTRVGCSGTPVPRDAKRPIILCHAVHPLFLFPPPAHVVLRSPALSTRPSWVTSGRLCGAANPSTTASSCARLLRYSHVKFSGGRLCRRRYGCSVTCTRLPGFE